MSSKTKKTVSSTSNISVVSSIQSPQQSSTPIGSRPSSSAGRPSSPLSPTRHSRLQEKENLQNLNDRLAAYIDKVRQLESENSGLRREIQTTTEVVTREVSNIKVMYEHELQEARKLLDETCREKAKLEIDLKRLYEENDDLKKRLDKKTKDCTSAENLARHYETRFNDESNKYNNALADKKKAQDELRELNKELEKLRKVYADTRKSLEDEMLMRIDMENNVQSLREELSFKDQVFQQELQETRTRRQVEISEIDGRLAQQYEAKLQQSLQELREQQEANIKANRDEIESLYENKMKNLQSASHRNSQAATVAVEELRTMRTRIDSLNAQLNDLENKNASLSNRCRELERQLESERARHAEDLNSLEQELSRLRDEMAAQLREYATLMDIKISLDHEIATYRALLEGEEDRLNLTSQSPGRESRASVSGSGRNTPGRRGTPLRATRKRTLLDESEERSLQDFSVTSSAKGDLEIAEACPEGSFIKIRNKGKKEQSLSGYQVLRKAGDQETVFKFHRTVKLEPGAVATVWSADVGAEHDPPRDIVMKGQKWFVADNFTTQLISPDQEEVAVSERQRRQVSTSAQRHRELAHKYPRREQELNKELEKLRKVYADTRKSLEDEMLMRIDMENNVQSLREELSFKDQVFQQELQETRTRRQVEISEIDGRLAQQYEAKLQQSLQELREQQEANIKANRDEIESLYENKMKNLQSASHRNSQAATVAVEELRTMRTRIDSLNAQLNDLENKNASLSNRCRELERQLESERARHAEDLNSLEQELSRLRDEMAAQLREYATLMDIKISLDHEIATYRALLEGEEDRLNLTSQSPGRESRASVSGSGRNTPGRRGTPLRATRKRTLLDESEERSLQDFSVTSSAKGDLEIAEACPEGSFIKIRNKGKKEQSLSGYQVLRKAGDQETVFKFHRTVKLEPGAVATVWSADVGAEHDPPRDIVMKGQKWFVADNFTTQLISPDQEEVAVSERQRRQVSTSAQRHRELAHKYPRREQLGQIREGDENCRIM